MSFAKTLQKLRKENNLTQEELSKKLYVSRTAVSKWESDKGYPNIESLKDIAKIFNVSIDELLSGEEIIDIAKKEKCLNNKRLVNLVCGLLDIVCFFVIFLPIFPFKYENFIYSVSLFSQNDLSIGIKISYIITLSVLSLIGIVEIINYFVGNIKLQKPIAFTSFCYQGFLMLYFIITRQIYLSVIIVILLVIKVIVVVKDIVYNAKTIK